MGACGMGMDLVQDPTQRLSVLAASFFDSRALRIAAEARIADILDGVDPREGIFIDVIAARVGCSAPQLSKPLNFVSVSASQTECVQRLCSDAYVLYIYSMRSKWTTMPITLRAV